MKNLKERQLAVRAMKSELGFAPRLEDIIPLESSHFLGKCNYVIFKVKGDKMRFKYTATLMGGCEVYDLTIDKDFE